MKMILGCVALAGLLAGCAGSPVGEARAARKAYEHDVQTYKACVIARGEVGCRNEKALMEADERSWQNHAAALSGGAYTVGAR